MFSGVWIDTAIGVAMFFLVMSIVTSAAVELVAQIAALRARTLRSGIDSLMQSFDKDPNKRLLKSIYDHSLVKGLADTRGLTWPYGIGNGSRPSYIPGRTFAAAFLDIVTANGPGQDLALKLKAYEEAQPQNQSQPFQELKKAVEAVRDELPKAAQRGRNSIDARERETTNLKTIATNAGDAAAVRRLEGILQVLTLDRGAFEAAAAEVGDRVVKLDLVIKATDFTRLTKDQRDAITAAVGTLERLTSPSGRSLASASEWIAEIKQPELQRLLSTLVGEGRSSIDELRNEVAQWFDNSMDRVSGWYKRRVQYINFGIGLLLAIVINADAIHVVRTIATNEKLRGELVVLSQNVAAIKADPDEKKRIEMIRGKSDILPVGWYRCEMKGAVCEPTSTLADPKDVRDGNIVWHWMSLLGWPLTALAAMLGAPLWFDALSALVRMRGTGKVPPPAASPATVTGGGAAP